MTELIHAAVVAIVWVVFALGVAAVAMVLTATLAVLWIRRWR